MYFFIALLLVYQPEIVINNGCPQENLKNIHILKCKISKNPDIFP